MELSATCNSVYEASNEIQLAVKQTSLLVCFYLLHDILLQKPDLLKKNPSMNTSELKDEVENKRQNVYFQVNCWGLSLFLFYFK